MSLYTSVTSLIDSFSEEFDEHAKATKKARELLKEKDVKATADAVEEQRLIILNEWKEKRLLGIKIHNELQEKDVLKENAIVEGRVEVEGEFDTDCLFLKNNTTYLEKKCIDNNNKIIGYADKVVVRNNYIDVIERKTYKNIYTSSSFISSTGFKVPAKYMSYPLDHKQDCNFEKIALQSSMYMYILWNNNKKLKPNKLILEHVVLSDTGKIIKIVKYDLPYYREEVKAILKFKKQNL
jgi:hypothetical protein